MHFAISIFYLVLAILLNPVLFLMSLNTILSFVLPPVVVDPSKETPPGPTFGPSAQIPHLNVHASEKLCWSYTFLIVCAQLAAFEKVSERRAADKMNARIKREHAQAKCGARNETGIAVHANGNVHAGSKAPKLEDQNRAVSKRAMRTPLKPSIRRQYFDILQRISSTAWRPRMKQD